VDSTGAATSAVSSTSTTQALKPGVKVKAKLPLLQVLTKSGSPLPFYSLAAQLPVDLESCADAYRYVAKKVALQRKRSAGHSQVVDDCAAGLFVYKVFSPEVLTEAQLGDMFVHWVKDTLVVQDWYAYPQYDHPQHFQVRRCAA
jgi:hypothetical protein